MAMMLSRRWLGYFSKSPLNYETLSSRIKHYSPKSNNPQQDMIDCIRACRSIELSYHGISDDNVSNNFLGLKLIQSRSSLEDKLHRFLLQLLEMNPIHQLVISAYLLTEPRPRNVSQIYELCVIAFGANVGDELSASRIVRCALIRLLKLEDYENAIKLLDSTYGSKKYVNSRKAQLQQIIALFCTCPLLTTLVSTAIFDDYVLIGATLINLSMAGAVGWTLARINTLDSATRIAWRPYMSVWHKWIHQQELINFNRIVVCFEELHEINIRNFHNLKVRQHFSNMLLIERADYIIELPDQSKDVLDQLLVLLRNQLQKRKMVLNDPEEELMVLEYWLTHGEKFTWDEPDQDPAEIVSLKMKHQVAIPLKETITKNTIGDNDNNNQRN